MITTDCSSTRTEETLEAVIRESLISHTHTHTHTLHSKHHIDLKLEGMQMW